MVLGVAGGLTEKLGPGQLLVGREVRDAGGLAPAPDPSLTQRAASLSGVRGGVLYSCDRILASAAEKIDLGRRLARYGLPAAVDLETATYARTAHERRVPYAADCAAALADVATVLVAGESSGR